MFFDQNQSDRPTVRSTRILVANVLELVAMGLAWDAIIEEWRGDIANEALGEAARLLPHALFYPPPIGLSFIITHA